MKYSWKVVMKNGNVYYVESEKSSPYDFAKEVIGEKVGININMFKMDKHSNGNNMVAIVGSEVSSFEWYAK